MSCVAKAPIYDSPVGGDAGFSEPTKWTTAKPATNHVRARDQATQQNLTMYTSSAIAWQPEARHLCRHTCQTHQTQTTNQILEIKSQ